MTVFDLVRLLVFGTFGVGIGLMVLTNLIAFQVLRPPKHLGFLWWHVTSVSISFLAIGIVAVEEVTSTLGNPPGWRSFLTLFGTTLYMISQFIIFKVERQRLIVAKAHAVVASAAAP